MKAVYYWYIYYHSAAETNHVNVNGVIMMPHDVKLQHIHPSLYTHYIISMAYVCQAHN